MNRPHAHTGTRRGKSDPIDAEAAARKVLYGAASGAAAGGRIVSLTQTMGIIDLSNNPQVRGG